ncbi:MAG: phasin family protein [Pseudomonadota bacterium]
MVTFNREALDVAIEFQMSLMSTASEFAQEAAEFATRQGQTMAMGWQRAATAKTPAEAMEIQMDTLKALIEAYTAESAKVISLADRAAHETGEAMRSAFPLSDR